MKQTIIYFTTLLMLFSATPASTTTTGMSYTDDTLQKDVHTEIESLENICISIGQKGIPTLGSPKIINYQTIIAPETATDPWEEIWTVQRKGYRVQYKVFFTPTPKQGGCDMRVRALFDKEDFQNSAMLNRQVRFFKELESYSLPTNSITSKLPPSNPSFRLYLVAEKIAEKQELIFDGTMASKGKLVVGKKQDGSDIIIGIQFIEFDNGGIGFENITESDSHEHTQECQQMEKLYISALTEEFYENFNK